jgi:PAS domain S-box-containing protein
MSSAVAEDPPPLVLLVDDVPEDRQTLRRYLTKDTEQPYRLREASGIAKAMEQAKEERPDCVLLDLNLLDGDGRQLLRQLVQEFGPHALGLIMLTGSGDASVAVEAMKLGAHDYVEKHLLTPRTLRRAVANAIEKASIQRQLAEQRQQLAQKNDELATHIMQLQYEARERRRAEKIAHDTVLQMRTVTDHLPINIAQFDREYRYRFANGFFAARYGLKPEDLIGRTIAEVTGNEIFAAFRDRMDEALAGRRVQFESAVKFEFGEKWMSVTYVPERNAAGEVVGFVALSVDISERKQAETAVAQARDEAVAATRARDIFLATLSHELRTPLNPVLLLASEAAENPALAPDVRQDFASIRDHVELEARLIDDLLDLSRISHGKLALARHPLSLHTVLGHALAVVQPEIDEKKLRLQLALASEDAVVNADAVRLQQIFWNVLKNAVKFTPTGGTLTVASEVDRPRRLAIVRVTDTGIGLTAEEVPKIFEAFTQGDHAGESGSHRFGGLGLGLTITRRLVEAHGGKISAESAGLNQGSTFRVELPLETAAPTLAPTLPAPDQARPVIDALTASTQGATRLLLVEDHASTRHSLSLLLKRRGFDVSTAASVVEAQELAAQKEFRLLISDIGLPDGDGYACLQTLRKLQPDLIGIALSGYGMEEDRRRSHEVGFAQHLTKPVNIQLLDQAIARALQSAPGGVRA